MAYNFNEYTYPSKDGIHTIYSELYTPKTGTARGIVQLAHGMVDHVGRYRLLADYLTDNGYIFAGNHHLGHGKSVTYPEDFGFFAGSDGIDFVLSDMHRMNRYLRDSFPTLPLVLMGHSMGSFLARLYVEKYPHSIKGVIIHGTAGPNKACGMGIALANIIGRVKGERHRSKLLHSLSTGAYAKKFDKSEGPNAWLSSDAEAIADHDSDPFATFRFTTSAYRDLFTMLRRSNSVEWFRAYPKSLPALIMSGNDDPVGNFGKGPAYVYKQMLIAGCEQVALKTYDGARHELFLEKNRETVFADMVKWLDGIIKQQ